MGRGGERSRAGAGQPARSDSSCPAIPGENRGSDEGRMENQMDKRGMELKWEDYGSDKQTGEM
jgi:hypothetical protein